MQSMLPCESPVVRVRYIIYEGRFIEISLSEFTYQRFRSSLPWRRAITNALLLIAKDASNLPADVKDAAPDIPWDKIEALAHFPRRERSGIDPELIWKFAREELPGIVSAAQTLAKTLKPSACDEALIRFYEGVAEDS